MNEILVEARTTFVANFIISIVLNIPPPPPPNMNDNKRLAIKARGDDKRPPPIKMSRPISINIIRGITHGLNISYGGETENYLNNKCAKCKMLKTSSR